MQKVVILGCGFVGKYLIKKLENNFDVYATSRNPENNLKDFANALTFDLTHSDTYKNIPSNSTIIWNFPAQPFDKVTSFYNYCLEHSISIKIIYGSTSAYLKKQGEVTENDPTDENIERVKGENFLLAKGTNILQLSGIYGHDKQPFNWLNKGLIKNANKNVNLIHVDDIVNITEKVLAIDINNQRINVTDGQEYLWKDLWALGQDRKLVNTPCPAYLEADHRYLSNKKLLGLFENYNFVKI